MAVLAVFQTEGDLSLPTLHCGLGLHLYLAVCKVLSQTVLLFKQHCAVGKKGTVSFICIEGS